MGDESEFPNDEDAAPNLGEGITEALRRAGFTEISAIRLHGMATDDAELRRISCALAFVGHVDDLRVGVNDDGDWSWRTPLLSLEKLRRFVELAMVVPLAFADSASHPGRHGNLMVITFAQMRRQITGGDDD